MENKWWLIFKLYDYGSNYIISPEFGSCIIPYSYATQPNIPVLIFPNYLETIKFIFNLWAKFGQQTTEC